MPDRFSSAARAMPGTVYSPFANRIEGHPGPLVPLHVGDTWRAPLHAAERVPGPTAVHRYGPTGGQPALLDALVEKHRERNGLDVERSGVLVTAGATSGLSCALSAVVDPGDEVLILAPFWPLIRGIVQSLRAVPVEVPFYDRVASAVDAVDAVSELASERTVALYVSTPSNPTGRVIPRSWLEALAELATRRDWWLLSDEVYEEVVYEGEHWSMGQAAAERCMTVNSFSKTYGMAGHRVGSLAGPPDWIAQAHKVSVHSAYHAPIAGQELALAALREDEGARWVAEARAQYEASGRAAAKVLGVPEPEGSTFLFVNVAHALDERGMDGFLEDCFEDGVLVAPGASAGSDYASWIRICTTSAPPDDVAWATERLARRLR